MIILTRQNLNLVRFWRVLRPHKLRIVLQSLLVTACLFGVITAKPVHATVFGYTQAGCLGPYLNSGPYNLNNSATADVAQTAMIVFGTCPNSSSPGTYGTAYADASANQASGQLKVAVQADGNTTASARAGFNDLLTIIPTSGFVESSFQIAVQMVLSGSITGNADAGGMVQLGSAFGNVQVGGDAATIMCTAAPSVCSPASPTPSGSQNQILTAYIDVSTSNPFLFIQDTLFAAANCINSNCLANQSGDADFSHTAQLSLLLPAGFTFTSDSGVFLSDINTGSGQTVPEPPTYAILLTGLGLFGFIVRRRKHIEAV
jgi:hypothetical protein